MKVHARLLAAIVLSLVTSTSSALAAAPGGSGYPLFGYDARRTGVNPRETAIDGASVAGLHKIWRADLGQTADSSPILLDGVRSADGAVHDVVYVTTKRGETEAFDAATGQRIWRAKPATGTLQGSQITTSSPAADPSGQWIYAASPDGKVHRYAAGTGHETIGAGWPVTVTLMPDVEKISSALNVANGSLYVTTSGYNGDFGPYDGHLVAIGLANASVHVFNSLCSDVHHLIGPAGTDSNSCGARQSGIWARGGAVVDQSQGPTAGVVYVDSGNGPFNGSTQFGDSVLAVSPDATTLFGFYTPSNHHELNTTDTDLGSMAPTLLPKQPGVATPWLLAVGGKDGILRLIDRAHMGGVGADLADLSLGIGQLLSAPVVWRDGAGRTWLFVSASGGLTGVQVTTAGGKPGLRRAWSTHSGGTSPVMAGNVLFMAGRDGTTRAFDPETGAQLWNSGLPWAGGGVNGVHWQSPIVAGGRLFMPDESGRLSAYCL